MARYKPRSPLPARDRRSTCSLRFESPVEMICLLKVAFESSIIPPSVERKDFRYAFKESDTRFMESCFLST